MNPLKIPIQFYAYLKKDFLLLIKRKKYLYLSILVPLVIALIFLLMLNPTEGRTTISVCDFDRSVISNQAITGLENYNSILLEQKDCEKNMINDIVTQKSAFGIVIEKGFAEKLTDLQQAKLIVYYDNTDVALSNLISWKVDASLYPFKRQILDTMNNDLQSKVSTVRSSVDFALELTPKSGPLFTRIEKVDADLKRLENLNSEFLVNPIWSEKKPIYDSKFTKDAGIAFIFPIVALFLVLMLSSTSLIYDKNIKFITRVKSTAWPGLYLLAKLAIYIAITTVQLVIILLVFLLYGSFYIPNIIGLINMILFIAVINTLIGLLIGFISDSEGIAILFSLIVSFPLMLLSGIFFPLQTMPLFIQYLSKLFPLYHQIIAVKSVLLFGHTISYYWFIAAFILLIIDYLLLRKVQ